MDISVCYHGSLVSLTPVSEAGEEWLTGNLPDDVQCLGRSRMCEPRYSDPIIEGAMADGMEVA